MTVVIQLDWVEQLSAMLSADDLAAVDCALQRLTDGAGGRAANIRISLLKYWTTLLGMAHGGAPIPLDIRSRDGFTSSELLGICGPFRAWTISYAHMEISCGQRCHTGHGAR